MNNSKQITSSFIKAYQQNDLEAMENVLQEFGVNQIESVVFGMAVYSKRLEVVKLMLRYGQDVNANNGQALIESTIQKNVEMINVLMDAGADPNMRDGECFKNVHKSQVYLPKESNVLEALNSRV